ncbi:tRNA (guanine(37)-N(1))-methyltransferase-like [Dermatophagoides farinae]|uniref:tRNA (guanine(37)-N(1))-methyltransferase-like n=1 Tax=Dermatophagoides farinae TaxID=6954 RepID=UPI003F61B9A1
MTTIYQMTHQKQNVETQVAEITLNANDLKYEKLLSKILPSNITAPFAFETIGHIIHLNFKDEILPYKYLIAEYLLKKHKNIRTVVNKVNKITSMFRECPFELLAGEPVYETTLKEKGFTFFIDYKNVYWNSRLSGERERLVICIPKNSFVIDVMAGVGGFGVYLAKLNNCRVISNDLNPVGFECIKKNIKLNKIADLIVSSNEDGRELIKKSEFERRKYCEDQVVYYIMNLPKTAMEFLDSFTGAEKRF